MYGYMVWTKLSKKSLNALLKEKDKFSVVESDKENIFFPYDIDYVVMTLRENGYEDIDNDVLNSTIKYINEQGSESVNDSVDNLIVTAYEDYLLDQKG